MVSIPSSRFPSRIPVSAALWVSLALLLFLAPCALAAPITFAWDAVPGAAGYTIYYGAVSRQYTATVDVGNTTTAALSALDPAKVYYVAVTAYDTAGNESNFSNEVQFNSAIHVYLRRHPQALLTIFISTDGLSLPAP
jgi:hypothetical protein